MLPKARHRARLLRCGALALMTAAFVPVAINSASASTIPGPVSFFGGLPGGYAVNWVSATEATDAKTVFNVRWELAEPIGPDVTAINHATALTTRCANCTAIAIGFQVISTTDRDLNTLRADDLAVATNKDCTGTCTSVADTYQVVAATDSAQPLRFSQLLSKQQLSELNNLQTQFQALPKSGLSLTQIQATCEDLANQAMGILQEGDAAGPNTDAPVYTSLSLPAISPAVSAMDDPPLVKLYKDIQFHPFKG